MRCASCYRCSRMSSLTSAAQDAPHSPKAFSGDGHIQHASPEILQHRLGSVKAVIHGGDDHACGASLHPAAAVQTCVGTQQPGSVLQVATDPPGYRFLPCPSFGCHSKLRAVEESAPILGTEPFDGAVRNLRASRPAPSSQTGCVASVTRLQGPIKQTRPSALSAENLMSLMLAEIGTALKI